MITGGLGDFGKAIVKEFLALGANIILTTTIKTKEKNSKKMKIFYLNFNDDISINTFEKKISKINKIDFLINNAGINILTRFIT